MPEDSLKQKAAKGVVWTAIQRYSGMIIQFVSGIILARLLDPSDYGCIGMLAIFMSMSQVFIDSGFDSALIQKKSPTSIDYSTVFYFNLGVAVFLYVVLYFCAPLIATFYRMPILCDIVRVQGLVLIVYSLNLIQRNRLRKRLQFNVLAKITIITSIISFIITVALAYIGWGVWALVTNNFIVAVIPCIYFYVTSDWRPKWEYSWASFRSLFGFGSFMLFSNLFETFCDRISSLLVGRWFNATTLGYFSKATGTSELASMSISGVVLETTYPLYSSVQDDKERMANIVKQAVTLLAYITVPLLLTLIVLAKPLIIILYSEKWLESVPYFQILCIGGMATCLQAVNTQPIAALGKSKVMFKWSVFKRSVGLVVLFTLLVTYGMKGLLIGVVFSTWFSYLVNISLVSKYVGYKFYRQLFDLSPIFLAAGTCALISCLCGTVLHLGLYINAIVQLLIIMVLYGGWSVLFKPAPFVYGISVLQLLKRK